MAFPTVKAGTTHVDAGTDRPSDARADIKQNIENVNAIIDDGPYPNTTAFEIDNNQLFTQSTATYFADTIINHDAASLITEVGSDGTITVPTGHYILHYCGDFVGGGSSVPDWTLSMFEKNFTIKQSEVTAETRYLDLTSAPNNTTHIQLSGRSNSASQNIRFKVEVFLTKIG